MRASDPSPLVLHQGVLCVIDLLYYLWMLFHNNFTL